MGDQYQRRAIESEMDRFEKEISSLAGAPTTSFIPAQLRRSIPPPAPGTVPITTQNVPNSSPTVVRPSPIIISGAPQVYAATSLNFKALAPNLFSTSLKQTTDAIQLASGSSAPNLNNLVSNAVIPGTSTTSNAAAAPSTTLASSSSQSTSVDNIPKPSSSTTHAMTEKKKKKKKKKQDGQDKKPRKALRSAGGQVWEDPTLQDWDPSGFRLFCGDLGNDVTDEVLTRVFGRYPSFQKAKVVRDKRSNKTKGFGFVSFKDPNDFVRAIKELDGRYVGSRPIKLRKSNWRNRNLDQARKKDKERTQILAQIRK